MSRILVVGTGPLYTPEVKVFCAQSMRTWHITQSLLNAGHEVDLVVTQTDGHTSKQIISPMNSMGRVFKDTFEYSIIYSSNPTVVLPILQQQVNTETFDCIVTVNVNSCAIAARLATTLPLWADLGGHMMGEAQTKCGIEQSDDLLLHFWKRQRNVLRRADSISTTGKRQMYAVLGELGALGRLGRKNASHTFCYHVPEAADSMFLETDSANYENILRGTVIPNDAFAVLWSGGYNTWTDIEALAAALTNAMQQIPNMHFVSTGGAIPGHDEKTYPSFVTLMNESGYNERCQFLGWIEGAKIPKLFTECDLGLNIDGANYETLFGGRNRLVNMMAAGLPVLTTMGTEFSEVIQDNQLGYTAGLGQVQQYTEAIIAASKSVSDREQTAHRAQNYIRQHYTANHVTQPLLEWASAPRMAPDNQAKLDAFPGASQLGSIAMNPLEAEALALENGVVTQVDVLHEELIALRSERDQLRGSRLYKLRETLHRFRKPK